MPAQTAQSTQHSALTTQLSTKRQDIITREAEAIWHITELLSKLESADNDSVTLSTSALHYFAQQISNHLNNIMEHTEHLEKP